MELKAQEHYTYLLDTLESLVKVYRTVLDVVRREKDILVSAKLDDLHENNKAKEALLLRVRSLETSRTKQARDLAQIVGADVEQPRLLEIASKMNAIQSDKLRNLHSVLDLLVRRVSEVNKQNEELVQAALKNISGAMDAIRDTLQEKPAYGRKGKMATAVKAGGNLVRKEG
jgi:hypothetical protein